MQILLYFPTLVVYALLSVAVSASPIKVIRGERSGVGSPSNIYTGPPLKTDNVPKNIQLPVALDSAPCSVSDPNPNPNRLENPNTTLNLHPNPYMMRHARLHTHNDDDAHPDADADTYVLRTCVRSHSDSLSDSLPSACSEDIGCTLGGPRHIHLRCKSLDVERSAMSGGEGGGGHTQFCARDTY